MGGGGGVAYAQGVICKVIQFSGKGGPICGSLHEEGGPIGRKIR